MNLHARVRLKLHIRDDVFAVFIMIHAGMSAKSVVFWPSESLAPLPFACDNFLLLSSDIQARSFPSRHSFAAASNLIDVVISSSIIYTQFFVSQLVLLLALLPRSIIFIIFKSNYSETHNTSAAAAVCCGRCLEVLFMANSIFISALSVHTSQTPDPNGKSQKEQRFD